MVRRMKGGGMAHWRVRRRIIHAALIFCAAAFLFALVGSVEPTVATAAIWATSGLAGSVIGAYVFGAAWEDIRAKEAGFDDWYGGMGATQLAPGWYGPSYPGGGGLVRVDDPDDP